MKRIMCVLLTCLMLFACAAAESYGGFLGEMIVVDCEEWVSLRASPSTSAERLAKVPLGAIVYNAFGYNEEFICCEYAGMTGYILGKYLDLPDAMDSYPESMRFGDVILDVTLDDLQILVVREYADECELMRAACFDRMNNCLWKIDMINPAVTELEGFTAFLGGTDDQPILLLHNASEGLTAVDYATGEELWFLSNRKCILGGSLSYAVNPKDGTMYVGGYYAPDPTAISMDGRVLWQVAAGDSYWLYSLQLSGDHLVAYYDNIDSFGTPGRMYISLDGQILQTIEG